MLNFMKELNNQFRLVIVESYHNYNRKKEIVYPYLTYDFDSESVERNVDGFYIDVDIFDKSTSFKNILELEEKLKAHFKDNQKLTGDIYIRFNFLRSMQVPTQNNTIIRRNLQFYCKVDWRKK